MKYFFAGHGCQLTPLLLVALLAGCSTTETFRYQYEPQIDADRTDAKVVTSEGSKVVELTNLDFKMLVLFKSEARIDLRLVIPNGKELFSEKSQILIFDASTRESLVIFQSDWRRLSGENFSKETDANRLVGLAGLSKATVYGSYILGSFGRASKVEVNPPIFRTDNNMIIEFDEITYGVLKAKSDSILIANESAEAVFSVLLGCLLLYIACS